MEEVANKSRSDITKIFNEVRTKITERESAMKK